MVDRSQKKSFLKRASRFAFTGVFVTAFHTLVAAFCIEYAGLSSPAGNGVAFVTATLVSYVINTVWSFSGALHGRTMFRFLIVSALGFTQAISVAWWMEKSGFNYLEGILAVAFSIPPVSFLLHNFWTYRPEGLSKPSKKDEAAKAGATGQI
ncbi:MAG: GtrA family protein [Gammaproteobacteria bacterium]|nr:GtrA family protein [Gammaproteobacteria bacterium]NBT45732.1 GtrA family protein [Gammaproteobacteria bacterium]